MAAATSRVVRFSKRFGNEAFAAELKAFYSQMLEETSSQARWTLVAETVGADDVDDLFAVAALAGALVDTAVITGLGGALAGVHVVQRLIAAWPALLALRVRVDEWPTDAVGAALAGCARHLQTLVVETLAPGGLAPSSVSTLAAALPGLPHLRVLRVQDLTQTYGDPRTLSEEEPTMWTALVRAVAVHLPVLTELVLRVDTLAASVLLQLARELSAETLTVLEVRVRHVVSDRMLATTATSVPNPTGAAGPRRLPLQTLELVVWAQWEDVPGRAVEVATRMLVQRAHASLVHVVVCGTFPSLQRLAAAPTLAACLNVETLGMVGPRDVHHPPTVARDVHASTAARSASIVAIAEALLPVLPRLVAVDIDCASVLPSAVQQIAPLVLRTRFLTEFPLPIGPDPDEELDATDTCKRAVVDARRTLEYFLSLGSHRRQQESEQLDALRPWLRPLAAQSAARWDAAPEPAPAGSSGPPDPFDLLPDELLLAVLGHLGPEDLLRASRVCQRWHVLVGALRELDRRAVFMCGTSDLNLLPQGPNMHVVDWVHEPNVRLPCTCGQLASAPVDRYLLVDPANALEWDSEENSHSANWDPMDEEDRDRELTARLATTRSTPLTPYANRHPLAYPPARWVVLAPLRKLVLDLTERCSTLLDARLLSASHAKPWLPTLVFLPDAALRPIHSSGVAALARLLLAVGTLQVPVPPTAAQAALKCGQDPAYHERRTRATSSFEHPTAVETLLARLCDRGFARAHGIVHDAGLSSSIGADNSDALHSDELAHSDAVGWRDAWHTRLLDASAVADLPGDAELVSRQDVQLPTSTPSLPGTWTAQDFWLDRAFPEYAGQVSLIVRSADPSGWDYLRWVLCKRAAHWRGTQLRGNASMGEFHRRFPSIAERSDADADESAYLARLLANLNVLEQRMQSACTVTAVVVVETMPLRRDVLWVGGVSRNGGHLVGAMVANTS